MELEEESKELINELRGDIQELREEIDALSSRRKRGFNWTGLVVALAVVGYFAMIITGLLVGGDG